MNTVPCDGCTECCRNDTIHLLAERGDDLSAFMWHWEHGKPVLDRKPNRDCIYLGSAGCTIHDRSPWVCRITDCREIFLATPKEMRRALIERNPHRARVYEAAKKRLHTLDAKGT